MISWAPLDPAPDLAKAVPCLINNGVLNNQGTKVPLPARIYVDDALTLATSKESMEQVLASLIKAIFVVMGAPDTSVHQCSLAMDKWEKLQVAPISLSGRRILAMLKITTFYFPKILNQFLMYISM
jgi:hypothetical protein